jgi:hypothetical protein
VTDPLVDPWLVALTSLLKKFKGGKDKSSSDRATDKIPTAKVKRTSIQLHLLARTLADPPTRSRRFRKVHHIEADAHEIQRFFFIERD